MGRANAICDWVVRLVPASVPNLPETGWRLVVVCSGSPGVGRVQRSAAEVTLLVKSVCYVVFWGRSFACLLEETAGTRLGPRILGNS